MKRLDFVIVGTFKSATSSLALKMQSHNEVNIPHPKDPYFFLRDYCLDLKEPEDFLSVHHGASRYEEEEFENSFMEKSSPCMRYGEATPLYLYRYREAIENIRDNNPEMKIVVVLRNPADRAYSNFMHNFKDGYEKSSFRDAVAEYVSREKEGLHPFFHYVKAGFYFRQVKAYMESFSQVFILTYEDFVVSPNEILSQLCEFLNLPPFSKEEDLLQLNKTGMIKNKILHDFLLKESKVKSVVRPIYRFVFRSEDRRRRIAESIKNKNMKKVDLEFDVRTVLNDLYRDDVIATSNLIGRPLKELWGM